MRTFQITRSKPLSEYTEDEINSMTQYELCYLWRFAETGVWANGDPNTKLAMKRMKEFGGFTPEISKSLGWD